MRIILALFVSLYLAGFPPIQADDSVSAMSSIDRTDMEQADLLFYAMSLLGTAYKYGGDSPLTGMDCSGFVRYVFSNAAGLQLPRSASEISMAGERVDEQDLRPGDLVFFDTLKHTFSHVGIYLGEHRFIHAPSSKTGKIMISDMTQKYWSMRFNGARRLTHALLPPGN